MLPNFYELTIENSSKTELGIYRLLEVINILLKLASIGLISLCTLVSEYYCILVVGVFILSMIASAVAGNITKYFKYEVKGDKLIVSKIGFNKRNKILFCDDIKNCKFTTKYVSKTIVATTNEVARILTNNEKFLLFSPDIYLTGLIENKIKSENDLL